MTVSIEAVAVLRRLRTSIKVFIAAIRCCGHVPLSLCYFVCYRHELVCSPLYRHQPSLLSTPSENSGFIVFVHSNILTTALVLSILRTK